jgi:hypothetical protein
LHPLQAKTLSFKVLVHLVVRTNMHIPEALAKEVIEY